MKKLLLLLVIGLMASSFADGQQAIRSIVSVTDHKPSSQSRPDLSKRSTGRHEPSSSATYNDQLVLSFVYGDGSFTSNIPICYFTTSTILGWYDLVSPDSDLYFPDIFWDSASNTATNYTGAPAAITYTMTLTSSDTSSAAFACPVSIAVPAGNFAAMSLTFISGSTDYPSTTSGDSITGENDSVYQSSFQPAVAYVENMGTVEYPFYLGPEPPPTPITRDMTTGYFKTEGSTDGIPWSSFYVPNWACSAAGGDASFQQYPYILFHIAGKGWYDYVDSVFKPNIALYGTAGDELAFAPLYMWNDTTAIFGYPGGAAGYFGGASTYNVSIGLSLQPFAADWPAGLILDTTTAYTIDSVMVTGSYRRAGVAIPTSAASVKNAANEVKAYPNPADNVVTIAFTLTTVSDVTVSLTNMVGQVVATQKVTGLSKGNAVLNTSALADGVYLYTLNANGYSNTGRIVVAHE